MKISACWITKNEEDAIVLSINSVKDIADELIVVDTGSTDDTVQRARDLGAAIYTFEWIKDFSAARNFTLSKATGDVIIFLDADEYFQPPLGAKDRETIVNAFSNQTVDALYTPRDNINTDTGRTITLDWVKRIFRHSPDIFYMKPIHEEIFKNGLPINCYRHQGMVMTHTGYTVNVITEKVNRNIELLEHSYATEKDPYKNFLTAVYLTREYGMVDRERAMHYWKIVAGQKEYWDGYCKTYGAAFIELLVMMIMRAVESRELVSRLYVRDTIFQTFRRNYPTYVLTPALDLLYQYSFDRKNGIFMKDFDAAMAKTRQGTTDYHLDNHKAFFINLYAAAAGVSTQRGDLTRAFSYAQSGFSSDLPNLSCINIMLHCIKDQPPADILNFLITLVDIRIEKDLKLITACLMRDGFKQLFLFFMKKQIEQGMAGEFEQLHYAFMSSTPADFMAHLQQFATAAKTPEQNDVIVKHLFLAAICLQSEQLYLDNKEMLSGLAPLLEAFFSDGALDGASEYLHILRGSYNYIAFTAGRDIANRFAAIFAAEPVERFRAQSRYCYDNLDYTALPGLSRAGIAEDDWEIYQIIIFGLVMQGNFDEALSHLRRFLAMEVINEDLLHLVWLITDRSEGEVKAAAQSLHSRYLPVMDAIIDCEDVARTGLLLVKGKNMQASKLRDMKPAAFEALVDGFRGEPAPKALLKALEQSAPIYAQEGAVLDAATCYARLIVHDRDVDGCREKLAALFRSANNKAMAAYFEA